MLNIHDDGQARVARIVSDEPADTLTGVLADKQTGMLSPFRGRTDRAQSGPPAVPDVLVMDTCVLISSTLRALLLNMAKSGWFTPVWSPIIGDEWRRTAARLWQTPTEDIALQWDALQEDFPDADMGDINSYKAGLERSDRKDWHVIAAGRVAVNRYPSSTVAIVTRNIKDFHRAELRSLGLYLFDPDQLMTRFWSCDADHVRQQLTDLSGHVLVPGRGPETLEVLLKRERLFRLNRLLHVST